MKDTTLNTLTISSPIGLLTLVSDGAALIEIRFGGDSMGSEASGDRILSVAAAQLAEYFAGERTDFDLPLAPRGTPFQQQAWGALRQIEFGGTISYGQQAVRLGDPNRSRAVGAANGQNPIPIVIPCHRVVGANGKLTGYAGGLDIKAWLLEHERRVSGQTLV